MVAQAAPILPGVTMSELTPGQLANMELAAERSFVTAAKQCPDCAVRAWVKRWTDKGLSPRMVARIMVGRKSKATVRRERQERERRPPPSPWRDQDYSGERL